MPRAVPAASVLVDNLPPPTQGPPPAARLTHDVLHNYVELERVTYAADLVIAGARPEHLEQQPLPVLIVGVRGDDGEPFGFHIMRALNPYYPMGQFLKSPLGEQLTPELAAFMKLDAAALRAGGLSAQDVRELGWPLSRWNYLFGVGIPFFTDLGMRAREFTMDAHEALATAVLPVEDDGTSEPLFRIEL
jgi:hypothetical protein